VTLRRHRTPHGRFRVEIMGGEADGTVIDFRTFEAAVRWYRLLLWQEERQREERQPRGDEGEPGRTGGSPEGGHGEEQHGDDQA
jgi:hypothetical protein